MLFIIGYCVLGGAAAFELIYILNPASFSSEQTISSPIAYVLLTIFSTYFYVVALPLSIGCTGISVVLYKNQYISSKRCAVSTITNSIGAVLLAVLIYKVFG